MTEERKEASERLKVNSFSISLMVFTEEAIRLTDDDERFAGCD